MELYGTGSNRSDLFNIYNLNKKSIIKLLRPHFPHRPAVPSAPPPHPPRGPPLSPPRDPPGPAEPRAGLGSPRRSPTRTSARSPMRSGSFFELEFVIPARCRWVVRVGGGFFPPPPPPFLRVSLPPPTALPTPSNQMNESRGLSRPVPPPR